MDSKSPHLGKKRRPYPPSALKKPVGRRGEEREVVRHKSHLSSGEEQARAFREET